MSSWLHRLIKRSALDAAFDRVAENQGGPGVDGQTLADFGALIDVEISALQHEVLSGTYQPKALLSVNLPRAGKRPRELGIPSVRDRVLQTACAQLLTPTLEAAFEDCSFAYRSGRSVRQAVARIELLRNEGYSYVVDADIETFFDSIPHHGLLTTLGSHVNDSRFVDLVGQWLRTPILRGDGEVYSRSMGIAQGSPLSPLLANLYLDALDEAILDENFRMVRYADDFLILCKSPERAEQALTLTRETLTALGLALNAQKTRLTTFNQGFRFLGMHFVRSLAIKASREDSSDSTGISTPTTPSARDTPRGDTPATRSTHDSLGTALAEALQHALAEHPLDHREEIGNDNLAPAGNGYDSKAASSDAQLYNSDDARLLDGLDVLNEGGNKGDPDLADAMPISSPPHALSPHSLATLYLLEPGTELARQGERLVVRRANQAELALPATAVDLVFAFGQHKITAAATQLCLWQGISTVLVGRNGHCYGVIQPATRGNHTLHRAQWSAADDAPFALEIARKIVAAKLRNSAVVLRRLYRTHSRPTLETTATKLSRAADGCKLAVSLDALRGIEGSAAAATFAAWRALLPSELGFNERLARPAPDPVNALLSLGYTLLHQNVSAFLQGRGLDPHIGLLHSTGGTHHALASDVMEPFRAPLVDALVLDFALRKHTTALVTAMREHRQQNRSDSDVDALYRTAPTFRLGPEVTRAFLTAFEDAITRNIRFASTKISSAAIPRSDDVIFGGHWRALIDAQTQAIVQAIRSQNPADFNPFTNR